MHVALHPRLRQVIFSSYIARSNFFFSRLIPSLCVRSPRETQRHSPRRERMFSVWFLYTYQHPSIFSKRASYRNWRFNYTVDIPLTGSFLCLFVFIERSFSKGRIRRRSRREYTAGSAWEIRRTPIGITLEIEVAATFHAEIALFLPGRSQ